MEPQPNSTGEVSRPDIERNGVNYRFTTNFPTAMSVARDPVNARHNIADLNQRDVFVALATQGHGVVVQEATNVYGEPVEGYAAFYEPAESGRLVCDVLSHLSASHPDNFDPFDSETVTRLNFDTIAQLTAEAFATAKTEREQLIQGIGQMVMYAPQPDSIGLMIIPNCQ